MDTGKVIQDLKRFAAFCEEWHKPEVSVQYIAYHTDDLTDSKTFDMTEETESQSCGHGEAGHVEGDLDSGVWNLQNIGHFSRKEVCRDDRKSAAVGEGDANADQHIADDKIEHAPSQCGRENIDPIFVQVQKFAKSKANNKTAQIG